VRRRGMIKTVQPNVHIHGQISGFLQTFGSLPEIVRWNGFAGYSADGEPGIELRTQLRWMARIFTWARKFWHVTDFLWIF
jgi:hypothetical protein